MVERWDALVVAEDAGGWIAAALLARGAGMRIAVLERPRAHLELGPAELPAGSRTRPGLALRPLLEGLIGAPLAPASAAERLVFPDMALDLPVEPAALREALSACFPRARRSREQATRRLERAAAAALETPLAGRGGLLLRLLGARRGRASPDRLAPWLDARIADPRLKSVLGARWSRGGAPPETIGLVAHGVTWRPRLRGGFAVDLDVLRSAARAAVEAGGGRWSIGRPELARDGLRVEGTRLDAPLRLRDDAAAPGLALVGLELELDPSAPALPTGGLWLHRQWSQAAMWREREGVFEGAPQLILLLPQPRGARVIAAVDRRPRAVDIATVKEGLLKAAEAATPGMRDALRGAELRLGDEGVLGVRARFAASASGSVDPGWRRIDAALPGFAGAALAGVLAALDAPAGPRGSDLAAMVRGGSARPG